MRRRGSISASSAVLLSLVTALLVLVSGCEENSREATAKTAIAAGVQPEAHLVYPGFREVFRTFTEGKPKTADSVAQPSVEEIAWSTTQRFRLIEVMAWYSDEFTKAGWASCPDASAPDLSANRIDYCKTVNDRPHRAVLLSGSKGELTASDFKIRYLIYPPTPHA